MTDKLRELLEDVQTVYEGKGMVVHPNSFDKLRMEVIKLDNINKQQSEQIEKMKCCGNCKKLRGRFDHNTHINILYCSDSDMKQIEVGFQMCCCNWEIK